MAKRYDSMSPTTHVNKKFTGRRIRSQISANAMKIEVNGKYRKINMISPKVVSFVESVEENGPAAIK